MQGEDSALQMDEPMSPCHPLGWGHCDGKDSRDSQMAKPRPGNTRPAELSPGSAGTLQVPSALPLRSFAAVLPLPLLASDVSMEFLPSLTFLTPHRPQSLPTSSSGFCPELQRVQQPLEPKITPSPSAQAPGPGHVETCAHPSL